MSQPLNFASVHKECFLTLNANTLKVDPSFNQQVTNVMLSFTILSTKTDKHSKGKGYHRVAV